MGLSETWLKNHKEAELKISGYTIFRCDSSRKKKSKRGRYTGGVALYVRDDIAISCEEVVKHSSDAVQLLCLYSKSENLAIACIYRQPDDTFHGHPSTSKDLKIALSKLVNELGSISPCPDIILGGDFNMPHVTWPEASPSKGASLDEKLMCNVINEVCNELLLSQVVKSPTHKDGNVLDLVFVNNTSIVHNTTIIPVLQSTSHHSIVQIATTYKAEPQSKYQPPPKASGFHALNFHSDKVEWDSLTEKLLSIDWTDNFKDRTEDEKLSFIYNETCKIAAEFVPAKTSSEKKHASRVQRHRKALIMRRRRIVKRLTRITSPTQIQTLRLELLTIEKSLQKSYRDSAEYAEQKAVDSIKKNAKFFYSYAKKKAKCKSDVGPLLNADNVLTSDNKEMADLLSLQYSSVFSTPKADIGDSRTQRPANTISDIAFTVEDMELAISELRANAAAGDDGFPAILLLKCKSALAVPLTEFWRGCLDASFIPARLKKSIITPIHKGKGESRAAPASYRPVALTSHIIKLFEKILRKNIVRHMNENNLFNDSQHGFRSGRSCLSQLLDHIDKIFDFLENGFNVDAVYLDFSKAFDKLDFNIVFKKLEEMGISGKILGWIKSFLSDRVQQVVVNGVKSDPTPVISGVPQGSVIGPLLFLVLISDIDEDIVDAVVKSFADDTRALHHILTAEDVTTLQKELQKLYKWSDANNMLLNDGKFEAMRYGLNNDIKSSTCYKTPSGQTITVKSTIKDLGVLLSDDCSFNDHINNITEKARDMVAWILRTFNTRQPEHMLLLYKTLVRPILEYCSVLWSPLDIGSIRTLEEIQRSFVRKIHYDADSDYWKRLEDLKLYSLERRRERYQIIYVWKILEGLVPNVNSKIESVMHARLGRKCNVPILKQGRLQKFRAASLAVHGANLFNALPKSVRGITGTKVDAFKRSLDNYLKSLPDQPLMPGYTKYRRASSNSIIHMSNQAKICSRFPSLSEATVNAGDVHLSDSR